LVESAGRDFPTGAIYGVKDEKLVFLQYMIAQDDFIKGVNHTNVAGMNGVSLLIYQKLTLFCRLVMRGTVLYSGK